MQGARCGWKTPGRPPAAAPGWCSADTRARPPPGSWLNRRDRGNACGPPDIWFLYYQRHALGSLFMTDPPEANLNLWKNRLGRVPESVWERTDLETLVLAD